MQNLAGFIFPHPDAPKTCPVFPFPIRIHPKPARFYTQIIVAGHFRAYAIRPYTGTPKKLSGFIFPHTDTPKTCPILDPNPCRRTFRGVCNTPLHGCAQNLPDFRPKPSSQDISGRMQYAPTRVRAKPARFHISTPGCTQNLPSLPLPNKDTPKTCLFLDLNLQRGVFRGVCFCALHRYVHNSSSFIFPHSDTSKTHPVLPFPIGIRPNPARF